MKLGEVYGGFKLLSITPVEDISARVHLFRHEKTGAELVWTGRSEQNKTFSIAFQTIPQDDTGVFHILEHSVLGGSKRFPVREPFVELLKGSLNTFLNALTFPDKTMYPVSSRNDADFRNLVRVYLDAVFCPAIYENENIFLQEGWRYEVDESGAPHYVGVVFGEMTGAFSSVDEVIDTEMMRQLYPDSCYGYVYGGDPAHIPELTYEQFIEAHKRFYHPSNARIFLDGDMDVADILSEIDREYLSRYQRRAPDFEIGMQKPVPSHESTVRYAVTPDGQDQDQAHFAMGRVVSDWNSPEKNMALDVLRAYLTGSNSAPLTQAILARGLGRDVRFSVADGVAQSFVMLQVRNTSEEKLEQMGEAVRSIIRELVQKGLDRQELAACLNRLEFRTREQREPYGVQLAILASQSWQYGGRPEMYFETSRIFAFLREKLDTSYFEDLLSEVFLAEDGVVSLKVLPSETLATENAQKQEERLHAEFERFSAEERERITKKQKALALWQQTPDSPEALATIPHISVKDIPAEPLLTKVEESSLNGVRVLRPDVKTNGTAYLDLYFALPGGRPETLPVAALLCRVLTELPTANYTAQELQRAIKSDLGEMRFQVEAFSRPGVSDQCTPYIRASVSALESKLPEAVSLLGEVMTRTQFDHPDKLREIVMQCLVEHQQGVIANGVVYALRHALAGKTAEGLVQEYSGGYACFDWLRGVSGELDSRIPEVVAGLKAISASFVTARLTVSAAGNVTDGHISDLCSAFPAGEVGAVQVIRAVPSAANDAIVIPAPIGYAVKALDLCPVCGKPSGSMMLVSKLLSLEYLWNEIRVRGGAYGAGLNLIPSGSTLYFSFRDPDPARSLDVYSGAPDYLRRCCAEKKPLDQLIIGAVSDSEPLLSAHDQALTAAARVLRGITVEDKMTERRELLNTTHDELLECCRILEEAGKHSCRCVVAGEALVDACAAGFDKKLRA